VEGFDRLWALRSRLEIPLAHILAVEANVDQVGRWWHGFKLMGTEVPGLLAAGTFYLHGELAIWAVHNPAKTIIVSLDHERYKENDRGSRRSTRSGRSTPAGARTV